MHGFYFSKWTGQRRSLAQDCSGLFIFQPLSLRSDGTNANCNTKSSLFLGILHRNMGEKSEILLAKKEVSIYNESVNFNQIKKHCGIPEED